jgi:hypothetical protein
MFVGYSGERRMLEFKFTAAGDNRRGLDRWEQPNGRKLDRHVPDDSFVAVI